MKQSLKKYPSDLKMRWATLSPLEPKPRKIILWDDYLEAADLSKPGCSSSCLWWSVACAVVWAILLVLLIGNWQVPVDHILDTAAHQVDVVEGNQR